MGVRSYGHPKNMLGDEALNDLKKLKVRNWTYLVKDRKAWYELVQKTKTQMGLECRQKKQEKNKKEIWCVKHLSFSLV
jgi:hypothetical protein